MRRRTGWSPIQRNGTGHADDRNPRCDGLNGANWWAAATDHEDLDLDLGLGQLARHIRKPWVRNPYAASFRDQVAALDRPLRRNSSNSAVTSGDPRGLAFRTPMR